MSGRRVILHVGPHKTGSTYLQLHMAANRSRLAELGVTYPRIEPGIASHRSVHFHLCGWWNAPGAQAVEGRLPELRAAETLILSSENLVMLDRSQLVRLRELLPDHEVQVVYMLRSLAQLLPSHWRETVRHGNPNTLPEYLERATRREEGDLAHVLPTIQLAKFAELFGSEALTILDYNQASSAEGGLMEAFVEQALGLPRDSLAVDGGVVNPSQPASRVELLRSLNERHAATGQTPPGPRLRQAYFRIRPEIEPTPSWQEWVAAFGEVATSVTLDETDRLPQAERIAVAETFGHRMVCPLAAPVAQTVTKCAPAGWASESTFVDGIFARLNY